MVEADFRAEMRRIDLPTLTVHGDRDRSMPLELTASLPPTSSPAQGFLVYPGERHGLMFAHMDELHADLLAFMCERRASAAAA